MSRLDDLIDELCPDGVEFVPLGDLITYEQPTKYLVQSTAYDDRFTTPVLTAGQTFVLGRTDEVDGICPASHDDPVLIFDDFTTAFKWVDFPFKAKSSAMKILRSGSTNGLLRYVYFAMQTIRYVPQNHARHWIATYAKFRIPLPPLEVQREIVRILDTFSKLESELESELESRRRQYEHYRDTLLTFPESGGVPRIPMGELGTFISGLTGKTKKDFSGGTAHFVSYSNVFNNLEVDLGCLETVQIRPHERQNLLQYGDVLFTGSSETKDEAGMSSVMCQKPTGPLYMNSFCVAFRPTGGGVLEPDFAKHLFRSRAMRKQIIKTANGVTRFNISKSRLARVTVPLPDTKEQRKISTTLDKFEQLANDLSIGLPAELKARRKQYEYYRDKLLTFKEKAA